MSLHVPLPCSPIVGSAQDPSTISAPSNRLHYFTCLDHFAITLPVLIVAQFHSTIQTTNNNFLPVRRRNYGSHFIFILSANRLLYVSRSSIPKPAASHPLNNRHPLSTWRMYRTMGHLWSSLFKPCSIDDPTCTILCRHTNFVPHLAGRYLTSNVNITIFDSNGKPESIPVGSESKFKIVFATANGFPADLYTKFTTRK